MVCTPANRVPRSEIDFLFCFVFPGEEEEEKGSTLIFLL